MRIASAPGRCGLLGNPSDIYGGAVLACSLGVRATCRLTPAERDVPPKDPRLWNAARRAIPADVASGGAWRVEWTSEIPRSSGLAGSTALLAATLAALAGTPPDPDDVRRAESQGAGIACGYQDAQMTVRGGLRLMDFAGRTPDESAAPVRHTELKAELPFLLVTTGVERLSGSVHAPMIARWRAGDPAVRDAMRRIGDLAAPGADALVRGDLAALAELMRRNHALVAREGGSGDAVDALVARCEAAGALGAKLAGAGLGGTVVALTEDATGLERALRERGYTRFLRPEIAPGTRMETLA